MNSPRHEKVLTGCVLNIHQFDEQKITTRESQRVGERAPYSGPARERRLTHIQLGRSELQIRTRRRGRRWKE